MKFLSFLKMARLVTESFFNCNSDIELLASCEFLEICSVCHLQGSAINGKNFIVEQGVPIAKNTQYVTETSLVIDQFLCDLMNYRTRFSVEGGRG